MRNSILAGASFGFGYITFLTEYGKCDRWQPQNYLGSTFDQP